MTTRTIYLLAALAFFGCASPTEPASPEVDQEDWCETTGLCACLDCENPIVWPPEVVCKLTGDCPDEGAP